MMSEENNNERSASWFNITCRKVKTAWEDTIVDYNPDLINPFTTLGEFIIILVYVSWIGYTGSKFRKLTSDPARLGVISIVITGLKTILLTIIKIFRSGKLQKSAGKLNDTIQDKSDDKTTWKKIVIEIATAVVTFGCDLTIIILNRTYSENFKEFYERFDVKIKYFPLSCGVILALLETVDIFWEKIDVSEIADPAVELDNLSTYSDN